jgi:ferredoxin
MWNHFRKLYRLTHRYNPFRAEVGLERIGNPGADAPVLVSGNYETMVEQVREAAAGFDCWLLICDSAGINVWCAAGVGDFNENKMADAIVAVGLERKVNHRRLVVSPLAAVGIDVRKLREETGFSVIWGPAHLRDLPRFLAADLHRTPEMKIAVFSWQDRFDQAIGICGVFALPLLLVRHFPAQVGWFMLSLWHAIWGTMLGYFRLFPRYPANKTLLLGAVQAVFTCWWHRRDANRRLFRERLMLGLAAHLLIAIDMIGSTPFFKTTIWHWLASGKNESLFQPGLNQKCTRCGACVEVCPKGVLERSPEGNIRVISANGCCECLACVKQCRFDAIDNVGTGFKDDIRSLPAITLQRLRSPIR